MSSVTRSRIYTHSYNSIVELLRTDLAVGDKLPVQVELARRCNASQGTISTVVRALRRNGLVGKGNSGQVLLRKPKQEHFLPAVQLLSRRESVERGVVEMLLAGELKPGTFISELALARQFKVTTGTVREAMLHLGRLGVFRKSARKQWHFARLNPEEINELMDLRVMIETYSLRRYLQRGEADDHVFAEMLPQAEAVARGPFTSPNTQLDWGLHRAILAGGGNKRLLEHFEFASFATQIQWLHYQNIAGSAEIRETAAAQHLELLKAILARDTRLAPQLLEAHLETARRNLLDAV